MRIRSTKPERPDLAYAEEIDPQDRRSWKRFGSCTYRHDYLYRLYDGDGHLLYVGITWNPHVRWTQHSAAKPWWDQVCRVELWRSEREDARHWESRCIKEQRSLYNIHQAVA